MIAGRTDSRPLVALTGATGFLGSHVADLLLERGCRVRASVRPTSNLRWIAGKGVTMVTVPLAASRGADPGPVAEGLDAFLEGADHVIHCAGAISSPDEAGFRIANVESTRALLAAAERSGTVNSFVLVSSLAAVGPRAPESPADERSPLNPISAYGRSKRDAEALLGERGRPFRTAALRPPALFGPRDPAFLPLFRMALRGWTAWPSTLGGISLVDGRTAARAAAALAFDERAAGPYFVAGGPPLRRRDLSAALSAIAGRRVRSLMLPMPPLLAAGRLIDRMFGGRIPSLSRDRLADLGAPGWTCRDDRLRRELDFEPESDIAAGFAETLAFYRREGWIRAQ